jgi:nitric oxide reductase large subunit
MNIKKRLESLYTKIARTGTKIGKPFRFNLIKQNILFIITFLYFAALLGGIVNTILEASKIPSTSIFVSVKDYETGTEFLIALINFIGGSAGVYLIYRGANSINKRDSRNNFVFGTIVLISATIVGIMFLYSKYMI